jgi:hypothetical protein
MSKVLIHTQSRPSAFEPDDIAAVYPYDRILGRREDIRVWIAEGNNEADFPNDFLLLEITPANQAEEDEMFAGLQRAQSEVWTRPAVPGDPEYDPDQDPADNVVVLGPRRWQFGKQDRIPPNLANKLDRDKFVVFDYDKATLNSFFIDRDGLEVLIP